MNQQPLPPDTFTPSLQQAYFSPKEDKPAPCTNSTAHWQFLNYFFTQLSLKQGVWEWKEDAVNAVREEMQQMHDLNVFQPVNKDSLTREDLCRALRAIIFLKKKRCGRIKACACTDGRKQRLLYSKEDASSPTVRTESVLLTLLIDAMEGRDVAIVDVPGAFLQARLDEIVHLCLIGLLADLMIKISPETYAPKAFKNNKGETVLYVILTRALYGC